MLGIEYAADQLIGFYHVAYLSDSLRHVLAQVLLGFILRLLVISRIGNVEDIVIVRYLVTVEDAAELCLHRFLDLDGLLLRAENPDLTYDY